MRIREKGFGGTSSHGRRFGNNYFSILRERPPRSARFAQPMELSSPTLLIIHGRISAARCDVGSVLGMWGILSVSFGPPLEGNVLTLHGVGVLHIHCW